MTLRSRIPKPRRISTALPSLDELFEKGGYPQGDLVEILGTPSSGRTILALYSTLIFLFNDRKARAAYLDSSAAFDARRCLRILKEVLIPRARQEGRSFPVDSQEGGVRKEMTDNEIALDVLNRLTVLKTKDSGAALDKISAEQQVTEKTRLGVVVIDQIDVLLEGEALHSMKSAQGKADSVYFYFDFAPGSVKSLRISVYEQVKRTSPLSLVASLLSQDAQPLLSSSS